MPFHRVKRTVFHSRCGPFCCTRMQLLKSGAQKMLRCTDIVACTTLGGNIRIVQTLIETPNSPYISAQSGICLCEVNPEVDNKKEELLID